MYHFHDSFYYELSKIGDKMTKNQDLRGQNSRNYIEKENVSNIENEKKCLDAMIWIGQSYPKILCNQTPPPDPTYSLYSEYCYLSPRGKKRRCFVHEAELRGCCRKVPRILEWMTPGKSLIFLVHRDIYKKNKRLKRKGNRSCGSIFGYFVLDRIEIITDPHVCENIHNGKLPWVQSLVKDIKNEAKERIEELNLGTVGGTNRKILENEVRKIFEKRKRSFIKTMGRGKNVEFRSRTKQSWNDADEEIEDFLSFLEYLIEKLIEELIKLLLGPEKVIKGEEKRNYTLVPQNVSELEADRYCSKRLKMGAIYLVDALTTTITDEFAKAIGNRNISVAASEKLFKETVNRIKENYRIKTAVPAFLEDKVEIRGELVLFKKINGKYPIFEKKPHASFRTALRVDGEELLKEIAEWYKEEGKYIPKIPYCGWDNEWTVSWIASRFGLTKKFAGRVLRNYRETLIEMDKKKEGGAVVFSDVGEFIATKKGIEFNPYVPECSDTKA